MDKGTNPLIILHLNTDMDLNYIDTCRVIISSESGTVKITYTDVTINAEESTITFQMPQEDSFKFYAGKIKIQVRLKFENGTIRASKILTTTLNDCLEDVII